MTGDAVLASLLERCVFPEAGAPVLCAVSGGADSLALLALASAAGLDVTAVHVDHGLRPGSEAEADVVAAAARRFGTAFRAEQAIVVDGPDLESRARTARWDVLGPDALTGHTADDQAETLLINLMRGAGLAGLGAMQPGGRHPLLDLRRSDTVALCVALDLEVVQDPSNRDPRFTRNRVRHELLPLLADISNRDIVPVLTRTAHLARSANAEIAAAASSIEPTDARALASAPVALASAAVRRWLTTNDGYGPSAAEVDRVLDVARGSAAGCQLSRGRTVRRTAGVLRLENTADS